MTKFSMTKVSMGVRIVLGLIFFVMGLNGFFNFMPQPEVPGPAGAYLGALAQTGYFFPVLKVTEITAGFLLLAGVAVPLALVLLAPIVVQIFLFHAFLAPSGLPLAFIVVACEAFLGYAYWGYFAPMFHTHMLPKPARHVDTRKALLT